MFKFIEGLPEDVLGVEASGKVTHEDYINVLIPKAEALMDKHKKIKFLYVVGAGFEGFELGAMWDDTAYGLKHWHDFTHIALVTDLQWIKSMFAMFVPFFPGQVRGFGLNELEDAKNWLVEESRKEAA